LPCKRFAFGRPRFVSLKPLLSNVGHGLILSFELWAELSLLTREFGFFQIALLFSSRWWTLSCHNQASEVPGTNCAPTPDDLRLMITSSFHRHLNVSGATARLSTFIRVCQDYDGKTQLQPVRESLLNTGVWPREH
jgi:hypothetical protein